MLQLRMLSTEKGDPLLIRIDQTGIIRVTFRIVFTPFVFGGILKEGLQNGQVTINDNLRP